MDKKIIFFDIDGTILSHRTGNISDSTRSAIQKARENGHLTFINTGRTLAEIEAAITDVGFDGLICGCGTYINYHGTVLLHQEIAPRLAKEIVDDLRSYQMDGLLEGTDEIYYDTTIYYDRLLTQRDTHRDIYHFNVRTWDVPEIHMDKFCIWTENKANFSLFFDKYKELFDFIDRKGRLFEVVPKGYSKATGIEFVINHFGIKRENTYALGDGPNDHLMLNYVKHSIAMGNADPDTQKLVSFITKDVDEDGVAYALKHFNIIE